MTGSSPAKILVVDDEVIITRDIREFLHTIGFDQVKTAGSFDKALEIVSSWPPDLILCDINLEEARNGIELVTLLKKERPYMKVIYISAYTDAKLLEGARATSPINYIVKPFNEKQLSVAIALAFDVHDTPASDELLKLSTQEIKVLELIAKNMSSREISDVLFVSEKTIRNHRYNICKKLDIPAQKNSLLKWALTHLK